MSILAKMGDWQVRGFALAGAEVGGGGAGEGAGRGEAESRSRGPGRRSRGEARRAAPRSVPRRERGQEKTGAGGGRGAGGHARHRPAGRRGKSGARSTGGPGGHLWFALQPPPPPTPASPPPPQVETGLDDSFGRGQGAGRGCAAPGGRFGARYASGLALDPRAAREPGLPCTCLSSRLHIWGNQQGGKTREGAGWTGRAGEHVLSGNALKSLRQVTLLTLACSRS